MALFTPRRLEGENTRRILSAMKRSRSAILVDVTEGQGADLPVTMTGVFQMS